MDPLGETLRALRFSSVVYCRVRACAPWGVAIPSVNGAGFHVVQRGAVVLEAAGHCVELGAGDIVLLPRGPAQRVADRRGGEVVPVEELLAGIDPHGPRVLTLGSQPATTEIMCGGFFFDRAIWDPLFTFLPDVVHLRGHDCAGTLLPTMLDAVAREIGSGGPAADVVLSRLGDVIFVELLRTSLRTGAVVGDGPSWVNALRDPQMARALQHMVREPKRRWSIDELADRVGVSRSAFTSRFRSTVGTSPLQYLTRWRMIKAVAYLEDTDWSVSRVAEEVGYGSEVSFAKAFKAAVGTPPGRYRSEAATRRAPP